MNTPFSLRSRRPALFAALSCAMIPLIASVVHGIPTASVSGNPSPPVQVAVGTSYDITVAGTPDPYHSICQVVASSCDGGPSGPSNDWHTHGYFGGFSNTTNVTKQHTFSMVNQTYGHYWWQPYTVEIDPDTNKTQGSDTDGDNYIGEYFTPYY